MAKYDLEDQEEYLLANNLLDAKDYEELEQLERVAFYIAQAQLEDKSNHDFLTPLTSQSFVELHRLLFKDIFRFAGEIRNVSLMKERTRFCEPQFIENQLKALIQEFNKEAEWATLKIAAQKLAYYKSELNMIHPFREGNGRTIRVFIRYLAMLKGYRWTLEEVGVNMQEYQQAMIVSVTDSTSLEHLIYKTLEKSQ